MKIIAQILIGLVTLEHLYFLYMEMFSWEKLGRKTFRGALPDELFKPTKVLAANQGLYNGFLAAGLVWSMLISNDTWSFNVAMFFLTCVVVAGVYGGLTASKKIILAQALPALVAILFLWLANC